MHGFTLIEVMLAMTVLLAAMAIMGNAFRGLSEGAERQATAQVASAALLAMRERYPPASGQSGGGNVSALLPGLTGRAANVASNLTWAATDNYYVFEGQRLVSMNPRRALDLNLNTFSPESR